MSGHRNQPSPARPWLRPAILLPAVLLAAIFLASGQSKLASPGGIPHLDKITHFHVFGLLATFVVRPGFAQRRPWIAAVQAVLFTSLYGAADEFHQSFTPGREVDVADWVADTSGAVLAVLLYVNWRGYRSLLERKISFRRKGDCPDSSAVQASAVT